MQLEEARIVEHRDIQGGYKLLVMSAPRIAPKVQPGQFLHIRVPHIDEALLRRPFSVFRTDGDTLAILYKDVGKGTRTMQYLKPGETLSLIGPLGHGFPAGTQGHFPVLVAGGYGMAALYLTARTLKQRGIAFFGGRSAQDILCVEDFKQLGWELRITTEDGSLGMRGLVTDAIDVWGANEGRGLNPEFFVCGPTGMLRAVAERAERNGWTAWVSVDNNMGCGVGACLTCVLKIREADDWVWARACREGPVFESGKIIWEALE